MLKVRCQMQNILGGRRTTYLYVLRSAFLKVFLSVEPFFMSIFIVELCLNSFTMLFYVRTICNKNFEKKHLSFEKPLSNLRGTQFKKH